MSIMKEPPQILRVKRKRTEDPLQALVMETSRRQIKRPRYVFRLKRTEEKDIDDSTAVLMASSNTQNNKPLFSIPSKKNDFENDENINNNNNININNDVSLKNSENNRKMSQSNNTNSNTDTNEGPIELNPELLEMLNDYLKDNDETAINSHVKPPKRRQSSLSQETANGNNIPKFNKEDVYKQYNNNAIDEKEEGEDVDDDEYVYDVYYRDKAVNDQWETEHIGYIKFDDKDIDKLDENDDDLLMNTDDEDSNDENFYRNDYPEDEDGGYEDDESDLESMGLDEPSDDQDDEFMILNDKRRFSRSDVLQSEGLKRISSEDYERLSEQIDEKPTLWGRTDDGMDDEDNTGDIDMDDTNNDDTDGETNFQRHSFFKTDIDDPNAIHRDMIFGKLQRMIEEKNISST